MRRIRLKLTGRPASGFKDELTRDAPVIWDADGLRVQVFLCDLEDQKDTFDIDTIESLTMEIRADDETSDLSAGPLEPDDALAECSFEEWNDDDGEHAEFTLTGAMLNFENGTRKFWLSVRAEITGGPPITFGAGYIKVVGHFHGDSGDPADDSTGGYVYLTSITPDATSGLHTFTARGQQFEMMLNNFEEEEEGDETGVAGGFLYLRSLTPDATTGEYQCSARGHRFTMLLNNIRTA